MNEISIEKFLEFKKKNVQVIDIREHYEYENGHIESTNIPMDQILHSIEKIDLKKDVIIYCQTGRRGAAVAYMLYKYYNIKNVSNLCGGYQAYINLKLKNNQN